MQYAGLYLRYFTFNVIGYIGCAVSYFNGTTFPSPSTQSMPSIDSMMAGTEPLRTAESHNYVSLESRMFFLVSCC